MTDDEPLPRGRGRPATGQVPKRYFRMDDESWEQVNQAAVANEKTTSEFVRQTLLKESARVLKAKSVRPTKQPSNDE